MIKHLLKGLLLPIVLWVNAFIIPEPYSHPLINVALLPHKLMPFLENREMMKELTILIFGRMTPNYAPITILFLIVFWFFVGLVLSMTIQYFLNKRKSTYNH